MRVTKLAWRLPQTILVTSGSACATLLGWQRHICHAQEGIKLEAIVLRLDGLRVAAKVATTWLYIQQTSNPARECFVRHVFSPRLQNLPRNVVSCKRTAVFLCKDGKRVYLLSGFRESSQAPLPTKSSSPTCTLIVNHHLMELYFFCIMHGRKICAACEMLVAKKAACAVQQYTFLSV